MRDNPSMKIRTSDPSYLKLVNRYLSNVLPLITPLLYSNGGPVIMVQIENEYGVFSCDLEYIRWLRDAFKQYLVDDVVLFSTDAAYDYLLVCSKVDGVYATVDLASRDNVLAADVGKPLAIQRLFEPKGPFVVSESYTGVLQRWSTDHESRNTTQVVNTLKQLLDLKASVSLFMFHGGTNFGFKNSAIADGIFYEPLTTSYDFDAPISEVGDLTEKYFAIRDLLGHYVKLPAVPAVYAGSFVVPPGREGQDTLLRLDGWGKGVAFVNGINIGRYWPDEGPQVTLYVPHVWLRPRSVNYIHLFETERAPCQDRNTCFVSLSDRHVLDGPTAEN
ncbi:Beta-galactosidase [Halotydeus destructor]|nr:Beta-galactosidase [Halotydeus destructor]